MIGLLARKTKTRVYTNWLRFEPVTLRAKEIRTMLRVIMGAGLVVFTSCAAFAQNPEGAPEFEVASVKPAAPPTEGRFRVGMSGGPGSADPGQLTYTNVTLKNVLMNAYGVKGYQISGPSWLDSERYDIAAKIPKGATKEQFMLMLQNLLAERFKLTLHREKKDLPMYALVVGKSGPKMKESVDGPSPGDGAAPGSGGAPGGATGGATGVVPAPPPPPPGGAPGNLAMGRITMGSDGFPKLPPGAGRGGLMMMMMNGRFRMAANQQSMSGLTEMLGNQLGRPVVDMTGLTAKYDFTLDFAPEPGQRMMGPMGAMPPPPPPPSVEGGAPVASAPDSQGPSLFTAVQEQLGLKLEPKKGPVDLLVIDHLEKVPTEN
jgi:uncharacterized protein (TIGR03435 family)